jgi:formylmethanofuran dehydrogenase subunit E
MRRIVKPVLCDKCGRMTKTYNTDSQGNRLCPVCITELEQENGGKIGPSEVKNAYAQS